MNYVIFPTAYTHRNWGLRACHCQSSHHAVWGQNQSLAFQPLLRRTKTSTSQPWSHTAIIKTGPPCKYPRNLYSGMLKVKFSCWYILNHTLFKHDHSILTWTVGQGRTEPIFSLSGHIHSEMGFLFLRWTGQKIWGKGKILLSSKVLPNVRILPVRSWLDQRCQEWDHA